MDKRGVFFSADAIIALIIILLTAAVAYPIIRYSYYDTTTQSDIIKVLSTLKIGEIDNSYVKQLILEKKITDLNKSILEQIGEFYSYNITMARDLANSTLSNLDTKDNIRIMYGNTIIFSKNHSSYETARNIIADKQTISGIHEGGNVTGFSARSFLTRTSQEKYYYFGGYFGEGNISIVINYNGNLTGVYLEIAANKDFKIYINNNESGQYENSSSEFLPKEYDLSAYVDKFQSGNNTIKISSENLYIAGGFLKIIYTEPAISNDTKYYFPGIEGIINVYDGFYIPGEISSMDIYLHYNSNASLFLNLGNTTVYRGNSSGSDTTVTVNNTQLSGFFNNNYNQLSMKIIPIRLGLENISYVLSGNRDVDVFSVNDISGSMCGTCSGVVCGLAQCCGWGCGSCNNNQQQCESCGGSCPGGIYEAKNATKAFIDSLMNSSLTNRIGLVGYSTNAENSNFKPLTTDNSSLKNFIDSQWIAVGSTCICCGINKAVNQLKQNDFNSTPNIRMDLLSYYNFDNNALDKGYLANNGTVNGASYYEGINDSALKFDGTNDNVATINPVNLPGQFTISVWINLSSDIPANTYFTILGTYNPGWRVFVRRGSGGTSNNRYYGFYDGGTRYEIFQTSALPMKWTHIVFTKNSSNQLSLYINGKFNQSWNIGAITASTNVLTVGQTASGGNNFNGTIDEVRIYNRSLSLAEIIALNKTSPNCGNSATEVSEVCDGNTVNCTDGTYYGTKSCNSACNGYNACDTSKNCSNGFKNRDEECDDKNVINNDGCSSNCKKENRYKAIVVMSDGQANYYCSNFNDYTGSSGTAQAITAAINSACNAWQNYSIKVYSVGFGPSVDAATLQSIADCGGGEYYYGNISEITSVYQHIAEDIIEGAYSEQTVIIEGDYWTKLYPDSYIDFTYNKNATPYGLVTSFERPFYDNSHGNFDVPIDSKVIDARVTSYSGPRWTDNVEINNISIFNLSQYGSDFTKFGDPYAISIPVDKINTSNLIKLTTGISPYNSTSGSLSNKVIYTILRDMVSYDSTIYSISEGCIWTIEFEDSTNMTLNVPQDYPGANTCFYQEGKETVYNENDAIEMAVFNMLKLLDIDSNGRIDTKLEVNDFNISVTQISGIPYSWSTEVKVVRWD